MKTLRSIGLSTFDIAFFALTCLFCFSFFQHGDLFHTASSSISLLRGHFQDFYEHAGGIHGKLNYLPSSYLLYAAWALPLEVLNLLGPQPIFAKSGFSQLSLIWYFKIFGVLCYLLTGYLIYKISRIIDLTKEASLSISISSIAHPIIIFSLLCFGQYDIITALVIILGIYFLVRKKLYSFAFTMGIAITFKYFPLFVFFPLLLLFEKRPRQLILATTLFFVPIILEVLPFIHSEAFREGVFGFSAAKRISSATLSNGHIPFSIVFFGWTLLCCYCYLKSSIDSASERFKQACYVSMASIVFVFIFLFWHPQWVLLPALLVSVTTAIAKKVKQNYLLDTVMMFVFLFFVTKVFPNNVDANLLKAGILGAFYPDVQPQSISTIGIIKSAPIEILLAVFNALLLSNIIFKTSLMTDPTPINSKGIVENFRSSILENRIRFYAGTWFFVLLSLFMFIKGVKS